MTRRDVLYYRVVKTHDYSQMGIYSVLVCRLNMVGGNVFFFCVR